ncbi:myosin-8-like [Limanda limanda]|uniref:myosin-8-like n=1 Tax=Limanda limanda TaxID=27771 RepID=UPI0029C71FF0|nr:myosin-8-like [Limanda limanda]
MCASKSRQLGHAGGTRQIDNLQRSKQKLEKEKKEFRLEADDLASNVEQLSRANNYSTRHFPSYVTAQILLRQPLVKEHQVELEDKVHLTNQLKEQFLLLERCCSLMTAEEEELRLVLEQNDWVRKMAEHELLEVVERVNMLSTQGRFSLMNHRKKMEADLSVLTGEVEEAIQERRSSDEKAKKAITDVRELQTELMVEQKKSDDYQNGVLRYERRVKELTYQTEEDRKTLLRMQELVEKLQTKVKSCKRQAENAEEQVSGTAVRFRKVQHELDHAEERADIAETTVNKLRIRTREQTTKVSVITE